MGWYCYHNRKCSDCGNVFQSEYDTLLMVNDKHLLCDKCGSYNSSEVLENLNEDELNPNGILKNYDTSVSRNDFDFDFQGMNNGHNAMFTYHANDIKSIIENLKSYLHNEKLMSKDDFSVHDLLFGDPNID